MNNTTKTAILAIGICIVCAIDSLITCQYCKHEAVKHNAATYEANSWGIPSFHWNDVSFAQAPFQDPDIYQKKIDQASQKRLNSLGIK